MLISCTSCYSKYLVNSADLKPNGRMVKCFKCGNQWFQEKTSNEEHEIFEFSKNSSSNSNPEKKLENNKTNLPSTYVQDQEVSIINSVLVFFSVIIFLIFFFFVKNLEINTLILLKFYFDEFYFNLRLIINDLATIIHQIIN